MGSHVRQKLPPRLPVSTVLPEGANMSARLLNPLFWVAIALTLTATATPQNSASTSQTAQPHYVGAGGRVATRARSMPFVKGPVGTDGKVHQVVPQQPVRSVPLGMTPEGIAAKKAAESGGATHSNVPQVQVYSPEQLQALGWNPRKLSVQPPPSPRQRKVRWRRAVRRPDLR